MSAGKGDKPRPMNGNRYRSNFDIIDWSKNADDRDAEFIREAKSKEPKFKSLHQVLSDLAKTGRAYE